MRVWCASLLCFPKTPLLRIAIPHTSHPFLTLRAHRLAPTLRACEIIKPATEIWINTTKHTRTNNHKITCNPWHTVEMSVMLVSWKIVSVTMSPCEAEDKANPFNEIQAHNTNGSVHLTFPPSLHPSIQLANLQPCSHTDSHPLFSFPAPQYCVNSGCCAVDYTKHFAALASQHSERRRQRQRGWGKQGINLRYATGVYLFYCCGNTFLLFHAAANTILRSL